MASSPKGNAYFRLLESNNTAQKAFFFSTAQHSGSSCHLYVHVSPPKVPSAQTQAVRALCDAKDQPMRAQLTPAPFRDTWRIKLPGPGSAGIPTPITSSHIPPILIFGELKAAVTAEVMQGISQKCRITQAGRDFTTI